MEENDSSKDAPAVTEVMDVDTSIEKEEKPEVRSSAEIIFAYISYISYTGALVTGTLRSLR